MIAIAWLDADLISLNRDWAEETRQLLGRFRKIPSGLLRKRHVRFLCLRFRRQIPAFRDPPGVLQRCYKCGRDEHVLIEAEWISWNFLSEFLEKSPIGIV